MLFSIILSVFSFTSCTKEQRTAPEVLTSSNRLKLSKAKFDEVYKKLRLSPSNKHGLPEYQSILRSNSTFLSLSKGLEDSKLSRTAIMAASARAVQLKKLSSLGPSNQRSSTDLPPGDIPIIGENPGYDEALEQMIADAAFTALLNEDAEIEVDNIIYKVTPFGTFFAPIGKGPEIDTVVQIVLSQNDYIFRLNDPTIPVHLRDISIGDTEYPEIKLLDREVYWVDSFLEEPPILDSLVQYASDEVTIPQVFPTPTILPDTATPPPPVLSPEMQQTFYLSQAVVTASSVGAPSTPYQNMLEIPIKFKSGLGLVAQTLFSNSTRYREFNSSHRMSALLYNRNWGLFKTLGIKIKFQKKGWLWWNKQETQEIRGGWDYIAYSSGSSQSVSLPNTDLPPSIGEQYLINPTENPYYATPMYGTNRNRYNLYGFKVSRGSNEIFSIVLPGWLTTYEASVNVKSSMFKFAIDWGWAKMKEILVASVPPTISDKLNFKFPVYSIKGTPGVTWMSINEMENAPKIYNTSIVGETIISNDRKIQAFLSPYEAIAYNDDKIDIPLEWEMAPITISTNPSNPALSLAQMGKSLLTKGFPISYKIRAASVFGTVKYNGQWLGIRLKVENED